MDLFHNISYANPAFTTPCSQSPNSGNQPPAHTARIVGITVQSALQHAILVDHAVKKERQHHGDEECRGEPRAERNAARQHDQDAGAVTGMPHERIWPTCDDVLSSVGLNTDDG